MFNMDILRNSDDNQIFEKYDTESTTNMSLAEIIKDESHQLTTVIVFVIAAVLVIISIFVLAVFIDCRQQKIQASRIERLRKKAKRKVQMAFPTLPTIGEVSAHTDDERTIVDNMETEESTSSHAYVV